MESDLETIRILVISIPPSLILTGAALVIVLDCLNRLLLLLQQLGTVNH